MKLTFLHVWGFLYIQGSIFCPLFYCYGGFWILRFFLRVDNGSIVFHPSYWHHTAHFFCHLKKEYIFPLPRNAFPREGMGVKTVFIFHEKVSLSAVVGKKDGCLTDQSSCLPERSEGRQHREVRQSFRPETKERETFSRKRKRSDCTISILGKRCLSRRMHFLSWEDVSKRLIGQNYKMVKWYMLK